VRRRNVFFFSYAWLDRYKCFRPGDVVRGQVLSLGDKRAYFVSTQRNDLGVVGAKCAVSGVPMLAASWETMKCPLTGTVEHRKVAGLTTK
jgi:exosome complex component CSL4